MCPCAFPVPLRIFSVISLSLAMTILALTLIANTTQAGVRWAVWITGGVAASTILYHLIVFLMFFGGRMLRTDSVWDTNVVYLSLTGVIFAYLLVVASLAVLAVATINCQKFLHAQEMNEELRAQVASMILSVCQCVALGCLAVFSSLMRRDETVSVTTILPVSSGHSQNHGSFSSEVQLAHCSCEFVSFPPQLPEYRRSLFLDAFPPEWIIYEMNIPTAHSRV